jgi:aminoglycoside phosphotransferase family enzyme/predicted kinase
MDKFLWLDAFKNPGAYPQTKEVRFVQTHISWVFITDTIVYKIKKPVNFGFLDFTTLEKREFYCNQEIILNKRLCPDIYKKVEKITENNGVFQIGGIGEPVEWCVVMDKMPEDYMMPRLINKEELDTNSIDLIVDALSPFYLDRDKHKDAAEFGKKNTVYFNINENFEQTRGFIDSVITREAYDFLFDYNMNFFNENNDLFEKRINDNRIVDGHGDLYSANICFNEKKDRVYVFDCIEFNDRFRCSDVVCDTGFLSMDLDFHGLYNLSSYFDNKIQNKLADEDFFKLLNFYKCYRAYVRGKIGCFTYAAPNIDDETRNNALNNAREYFNLALRYAGYKTTEKPTLYIFYGLSGTGKSYVSNIFSEKTGISLYNSDIVRKKILDINPQTHFYEEFQHGIYGKEMTDKTYRALLRNAAKNLIKYQSVILDATFIDPLWRKKAADIANDLGANIKFLHCACAEDVIKERIFKRIEEKVSSSDARWEIYLKQKQIFNKDEGISEIKSIDIETDKVCYDETFLEKLKK